MSQIDYPNTLKELNDSMESCFQFETQSVAEHGRSVANYYLELIQHLDKEKPLQFDWKIPSWVYSKELKSRLLPFQPTITYLIYHDCGKPFCRTVDEDGRQHFPNHAAVSKEVFDHLRKTNTFSKDDELISTLIAEDMDVHLLKGDGVAEFSKRNTAATQLLSGLSELHSNATMFGGLDSVGFKSKWKNLDRRGKAIVKLWKEQAQ